MKTVFSGGCLCGAVRYESMSEPVAAVHCQCIDCRKSSGSGHCSHLAVPAQAFRVTGEIRFYEAPADSGNVVGRGFCPTCGAAVYSVNAGTPDLVFPRASSLDDPEIFKPQLVVYAARATSWDYLDPALPKFAAMPQPQDMPV